MTLFKKRDERVNAVQFNPGNAFELEALRRHLEGYTGWNIDNGRLLTVPTTRGTITAVEGDYIIRDHTNSFLSVMAKAEFEALYEPES